MSVVAGKSFVVVGAGGGIGAHIARGLTAAGASVIGTSRTSATFESFTSFTAEQRELDLASVESIAGFLDDIDDLAVDGIVIAAGVVGFGNTVDTPADGVDYLMAVNALGPIRLVTALTPKLTLSGEGVIVTMSGIIAEAPMAGLAAYSASKAALHAFSVAAGRELRRSGIRWIDARPGHTDSGLATRAIFGTAPAFGVGLTPDAVARRIVDAIIGDEKDLPSGAFA